MLTRRRRWGGQREKCWNPICEVCRCEDGCAEGSFERLLGDDVVPQNQWVVGVISCLGYGDDDEGKKGSVMLGGSLSLSEAVRERVTS